MAKGKGDQPSSFEEFQAEIRRPGWRGRIPSRSDGPVYPRFRLQPYEPVKWRPLWVNLLILALFVLPFIGMIFLIARGHPYLWFFLFIFGLVYVIVAVGVISEWRKQPKPGFDTDQNDQDAEKNDEGL